jgi:uncharacterized LabA/DUF88 family protein
MRVALFFDGKNHMKDLRRAAGDRWLDHEALSKWTVEHVGGTELFAAYYYTGVPTPQDEGPERHALSDLLEDLEQKPGFFVKRFNRRAATRECPHCGQAIAYTEEKMVDTSLVADLILFAVRDAFDIAVVFSGDLDIAPGLQAVHALGKKCWIATFGDGGLSRSLLRSAWGTINLLDNLDKFSFADLAQLPAEQTPETPDEIDREMLRELRRAEAHFAAGGGFVGAHYFIHRWKGHHIPDAPDLRRQALQRLMAQHRVEAYISEGKTALRAYHEGGDEFGHETEPVQDPPRDIRDLKDPMDPFHTPPPTLSQLDKGLDPFRPEPTPMPPPTVVRRSPGVRFVRANLAAEEEDQAEIRVSENTKRIRRPVPIDGE